MDEERKKEKEKPRPRDHDLETLSSGFRLPSSSSP